MRRLATVLVVVLAGCSGGGDGGDAAPPTTRTTEAAWLDQFDGLTPAGEVDGEPVAVDEAERTIYVEDCAVAERLTQTGARYGPSTRDENGDYTPGYGTICRN